MDADFSMEELLALLEQERGPEIQGLSTDEIAERLGRSRGWVLARLRELHRAGRIRCSYRPGTRVDGRPCQIPVYTLSSTERSPDMK